MADFQHGDLILYRERGRDRLNVARVDLVRRDEVSSMPWYPLRRRFLVGRTRIERTRIVRKLPRSVPVADLVAELRVAELKRDRKRLAADKWLKRTIARIAHELEQEGC